MAILLHDPAVRDSIRARVQTLSPTSPRKWGKMSVDQMLWHCNQALRNSLGEFKPQPVRVPLPRSVLKVMVFNLPWMKGAPTTAEYVAGERYSFDAERDHLLRLIAEFTARGLDDTNWGWSVAWGDMCGRDWSRLQAKHLDHHLKQFSA